MPRHSITRRKALQSIGAGALAIGAFSGATAAQGGGLKKELAEVRSATAEYNDPENAYADGYFVPDPSTPEGEPPSPLPLEDVVDEGHSVCGMGFHFINPAKLGETDRTEPQVLAYGVDDDDNLILGAVEYVIPDAISGGDPDLFDHDDGEEVWHPGPFEGVHSLHAWVHTHNPDGVFHPLNPRKQFHPEDCESVPHGDHEH